MRYRRKFHSGILVPLLLWLVSSASCSPSATTTTTFSTSVLHTESPSPKEISSHGRLRRRTSSVLRGYDDNSHVFQSGSHIADDPRIVRPGIAESDGESNNDNQTYNAALQDDGYNNQTTTDPQQGDSNNNNNHTTTQWGTRDGYDQPGGTGAICWKTDSSFNGGDSTPQVLPSCGPNNRLWMDPPLLEQQKGQERLWIDETYRYIVHLNLNLTEMVATSGNNELIVVQSMALQILFCRVGQVSFCSPFVPEQLGALSDDAQQQQHQKPYEESHWIHIPVTPNSTQQEHLLQETFSIPTVVHQPGSYFVLAKLRIATTNNDGSSSTSSAIQWDMANGLPPNSDIANDPYYTRGRVVQYWHLPKIMDVSRGVLILSYVAVSIASVVLLFLILQTVKHRKNQVLHLSQAGFIHLFLVAALWATISTILLQPKNDVYCQMSSSMILIPIQLMYSITIGRLWRINAVISPLLVEHFRKNLSSQQRWTGKLVSWVHRRGTGSSGRNVQLRRTVTPRKLAWVISMFAVPQIVLQLCAVLIQPRERMVQFTPDGMTGVATCGNYGLDPAASILNYAYATLAMLLLLLLVMAYSCRKLPSLFNETHVIYNIIFRTFVFILFGVVVVVVLQAQQNSVVAPDVMYLLWVAVILYITLASSLGLVIPKLKMIWNGEVVIVSKLVSDHHRARREKKAARASATHSNGMGNVTGLDLSNSHSNSNTDSYLNGSFNTEAYLNGSIPNSFGGSFTGSSGVASPAELLSTSIHSEDGTKERPKLSEIRENSGVASCPRTMSTHSDSSRWLPMASEDAADYDDEDDGDLGDLEDGFPVEGEEDAPPRPRISPPQFGEWRNRMKNLRDKWHSRSMSSLVASGELRPNSRPSSEILPAISSATDDLDEPAEDVEEAELVTQSEHVLSQDTTRLSTSSRRKEYRRKKQKSRRRKSSIMIVSPNETPPRRLVLKMMDQHDCLTSVTTKIMSGLSVRPEEWDKLLRLHTILEKCLQEEVNFTWRKEIPIPEAQPSPTFDRGVSSRSLKLSDLEDKLPEETDDPSDAGNSRDNTLRRGNTHTGPLKKPKNLSDIAREFKRVVDCRDRKWGLGTVYKQCFIASDAVDALIYAGVADSREEAVAIGQRLAEEKHLFRHVTGDHSFSDRYLFFEYFSDNDSVCSSDGDDDDEGMETNIMHLSDINETTGPAAEVRAFREAISVRDRRYHLKLYPKVFVGCEAVDSLIYHGVAKSRWEAVQLGRRLAREHKLFKHVCQDHEFRDEHLFYRFSELDENGVESSLGSAMSDSARISRQPRSQIAELADAFEMYVDIRDRWYRTKKYRSCFIGSEAVDAMIYAGLADSREGAVALGRRLEKELRLFQHVCQDHHFKDAYLFYSLRRGGTAGSLGTSSGTGGRSRSAHSDNESAGGSSGQDKFQASMSSSSQGEKQTKLSHMQEKANAFRQCAVITTGAWRYRQYPNVFIGCDTVDRMVWTGLAKDRAEAVQIGRALARELRLFRHVADDHAFCDRYLFYRFRTDDDSSSAASLSTFSRNSNVPRSIQGGGETLNSQSNNNSLGTLQSGRSGLADKAEVFRSLADVADRKYRLRNYAACFVGGQVVDALLQRGVVATREEAVEYGRSLEKELRLFQHVCGAHPFSDDYLFYRFRDMGFKDGVDVLGTSLHSANELSVSSTVGFDTSRAELEADAMECMGGPAGRGYGLAVLDENTELDAETGHTRAYSSAAESNDDDELPELVHYRDVDNSHLEQTDSQVTRSSEETPTHAHQPVEYLPPTDCPLAMVGSERNGVETRSGDTAQPDPTSDLVV